MTYAVKGAKADVSQDRREMWCWSEEGGETVTVENAKPRGQPTRPGEVGFESELMLLGVFGRE